MKSNGFMYLSYINPLPFDKGLVTNNVFTKHLNCFDNIFFFFFLILSEHNNDVLI